MAPTGSTTATRRAGSNDRAAQSDRTGRRFRRVRSGRDGSQPSIWAGSVSPVATIPAQIDERDDSRPVCVGPASIASTPASGFLLELLANVFRSFVRTRQTLPQCRGTRRVLSNLSRVL